MKHVSENSKNSFNLYRNSVKRTHKEAETHSMPQNSILVTLRWIHVATDGGQCRNICFFFKNETANLLVPQKERTVLTIGFLNRSDSVVSETEFARFFVISFSLQSVLVHSANCVKTCIQWHVEEFSLAALCN
jgi:hypothetical protein